MIHVSRFARKRFSYFFLEFSFTYLIFDKSVQLKILSVYPECCSYSIIDYFLGYWLPFHSFYCWFVGCHGDFSFHISPAPVSCGSTSIEVRLKAIWYCEERTSDGFIFRCVLLAICCRWNPWGTYPLYRSYFDFLTALL